MTGLHWKKRQTAIDTLHELVKPGDTVYTVLRSVSKSGMFRRLDCYIIKDNRPVWITGEVAEIVPCRYGVEDWRKSAGLGLSGTGQIVSTLSLLLFTTNPEGGYALKQQWL